MTDWAYQFAVQRVQHYSALRTRFQDNDPQQYKDDVENALARYQAYVVERDEEHERTAVFQD